MVEKEVEGVVAEVEPEFLRWFTRELAKRYEVEVNVNITGKKPKWIKLPRNQSP